jgi:hypothetical protein
MSLAYESAYHCRCSISLSCGTRITLKSLTQRMTYGGLLEGTPTSDLNDDLLRNAVDRACKDPTMHGHVPFVVPPARRDFFREPGDMTRARRANWSQSGCQSSLALECSNLLCPRKTRACMPQPSPSFGSKTNMPCQFLKTSFNPSSPSTGHRMHLISSINQKANKTLQATPMKAWDLSVKQHAGLRHRYGVPDLLRWAKT